MVTAGVSWSRMNAVYQLAPLAMDVVAVMRNHRHFAASMPVQNDIKKVLAYSQLANLLHVLALGVGAFAAGIFI